MKAQYDFSRSIKNPYVKKLKQQISININTDTLEYFKNLAQKQGTPYQTLINLFLNDCAKRGLDIGVIA